MMLVSCVDCDYVWCVDAHHRLSCLPLIFCCLNLNNTWVCVGSVTQKKHGRTPGIDAFSCHGGVDDSPTGSARVNACTCMCLCVSTRMQTPPETHTLHNTSIISLKNGVRSSGDGMSQDVSSAKTKAATVCSQWELHYSIIPKITDQLLLTKVTCHVDLCCFACSTSQ